MEYGNSENGSRGLGASPNLRRSSVLPVGEQKPEVNADGSDALVRRSSVVMPEIRADTKSDNDSRGLGASPNLRVSSVLPVGQQTPRMKEAVTSITVVMPEIMSDTKSENDSRGLGASPNPRRSSVLPVGEQTTEAKEASVAIPEFDPERDFSIMPNWMRFYSKLKGAER